MLYGYMTKWTHKHNMVQWPYGQTTCPAVMVSQTWRALRVTSNIIR